MGEERKTIFSVLNHRRSMEQSTVLSHNVSLWAAHKCILVLLALYRSTATILLHHHLINLR